MSAITEFDRSILAALESLFHDDEIETLTFRPNGDQPTMDAAVKVVHTPTGTECVSNDFDSQIKNKSKALIELLAKLRSQ